MPAYAGTAKAALINANTQKFLFNNETVANGTKSIAFQLERQKSTSYPWGAAVEVSFSGDPGTVEIEVQGAETDTDANYCKLGSSIATLNAGFTGRFELIAYWPKFVRVNAKTITNAVAITAVLTR